MKTVMWLFQKPNLVILKKKKSKIPCLPEISSHFLADFAGLLVLCPCSSCCLLLVCQWVDTALDVETPSLFLRPL